MKKNNSKISYDADADVLMLAQKKGARIDHARELGNFVVHFTKKGEPVLIEVLEASKVFGSNRVPLKKMAAFVFART